MQNEKANKKDILEKEAQAVGLFISQCGQMAEQNWLPSQVEMLEHLFGAVLANCEYSEWEKS